MPNISSDTLSKFCSEDWIAKSYSEYLLDCADAQARLMNAITDACGDNQLDQIQETEEDNFSNKKEDILNAVRDAIKVEGHFTLNDLAPGSTAFNTKLSELAQDQTSIVSTKWNQLQSQYPDTFEDESVDYIFEVDPDDVVEYAPAVAAKIEAMVSNILLDFHCDSNTVFALGPGFVNFKDMLGKLISKGSLGNSFKDFILSATNGQNVSIGNISLNFTNVFDDLKSSFASAIAWGQGFACSSISNISDALAAFQSSIDTVISDTSEKFATIVNNVKATLSQCAGNVKNFFTTCYVELGWKDVVDDVYTIIDASNVAEFSGASPFSAIYLKTAGDVLLATAKTIGAIASGIFMTVFNLVQKGWKKIRHVLAEFTGNPQDYRIDDSKSDKFYMTNAAYHTECVRARNFSIQFKAGSNPDFDLEQLSSDLNLMMTNNLNAWYSFDTYFGILSFKIVNNATGDYGRASYGLDVQFKPKCLWYQSLVKSGLCSFYAFSADTPNDLHFGKASPSSADIANFDTWLQIGDPYFHDNSQGTVESEEGYVALGFAASMMLFHYLSHRILVEISDSCNSEYGFQVDYIEDVVSGKKEYARTDTYPDLDLHFYVTAGSWPLGHWPNDITNYSFVQVTAGYNIPKYVTSSFDDDFYYWNNTALYPSKMSSNNSVGLLQLVGGFIAAFLIVQYDRYHHPTNYSWIPYCKGTYTDEGGRYKIVSDAYHQNLVGIVAGAMIIIAAVVITVVIGARIVNFFKARKWAKWNTVKGQIDNKMWTNQKITGRDKRRYLRATKKIDAISSATSGLAGTATTLSSVASSISKIVPTNLSSEDTSTDTSTNAGDTFEVLMDVKRLITG